MISSAWIVESTFRPQVAEGFWDRIDLVDELFGPGDPYGGADAGLQGQASLRAFGGLTGAAKVPGQPGQQAVDSASAVEPNADDGKLAGVRRELVIQPLGVGGTERDGDLGRPRSPAPRRWTRRSSRA